MMRLLLILISLLSLKANSTEYYEYIVQPGDTLSEIAEANNQSLVDIYNINKKLNFNPNKIEVGQSIILQKQTDIEENQCPIGHLLMAAEVYINSNNFFENRSDLESKCIDSRVTENLINQNYVVNEEFLTDKRTINSLSYIFESDLKENNIQNRVKDLICKSIKLGTVELYAYAQWCNFSFNEILDLPGKNESLDRALIFYTGLDTYETKEKVSQNISISSAASNIIPELIPDSFRVLHSYNLGAAAFYNNHQDLEKLLDKLFYTLVERLNSSNSYTTDWYEIGNTMYFFLNTGKEDKAYELFKLFKNKFCGGCSEKEMINGIISENANYWISKKFRYILITILNGTSAEYDVLQEPSFFEKRENIIKFLRDEKFNLQTELERPEDTVILDDTLAYFLSDTALKAGFRGNCSYASERLDESLSLRQELGYFENNSENYDTLGEAFSQLTSLSICFLKIQDNINALKYMKVAESFNYGFEDNYFRKIISTIFDAFIQDNKLSEALNKAYIDILNTPEELKNISFINDLSSLISILFLLHNDIDIKNLDLISLKNLKDNFSGSKDLLNIKILNKNKKLESLRNELIKISAKIKDKEEDIDYSSSQDRESIIGLYEIKTNIVESIFAESESLGALYKKENIKQEDVQSSLENNQFVLINFFLNGYSWSALIDKKNTYLNYIDGNYFYIKDLITKLSDSIGREFDFSTAQLLYDLLFEKVEKNVQTKSSIFLYDSENINIPYQVFARDVPKSQNYNRALIEADWIIRDYSFAYFYPFTKKENKVEYDETYLGIANASEYSWSELPVLKSSEREVTNLGISSNARIENILLGDQATKENFISKFSSKFERVVIATHAIPSGWRGYINESALVLPSKKKDFFLTPSEIAQIEINTEMVILSSCSGITEDFKKLYKSFLVAGAKSVVHANWNLESKFAAEFTDEFFKELWLKNDINKHEAIRNVALSFLDDYSNPMYADPAFWGNFSIGYSSL